MSLLTDPDRFAAWSKQAVVVIDAQSNDLAGIATIAPLPHGPGLSIGLDVRQEFRGKGYSRKLAAAAIAAFGQLGQPIFVGTATDNIAIQRTMRALGYEPEPAPRPYRAPNGEVIDSFWYPC